MGSGYFDASASATRAKVRAATGATAFTHDAAARAGTAPLLHPTLDVTKKSRRESRDVPGKQPATPIMVWLDVTGSMSQIPGLLIQDLSKLMKLVIDGKIVTDPQICFSAVGDATSDQVPIQVGEFEADDALAESHLSNIYLEGAGGGQSKESYELALWFAGNQVDTDAFEKRQEKGYLFIIGDEAPYKTVRRDLVKQYLGVSIDEDVSLKDAVAQASEKFHVFIIRPGGTGHYDSQDIQKAWAAVLPAERVIKQENWQDIAPLIAGTISVMSGESIDDTAVAMKASGFDSNSVDAATRSLVALANGSAAPVVSGIVPVTTGGSLPPKQRL
ncbi:hypothetical protein IAD21_05822 [Abditibacteriota bacterium]|nr:hypothetical protein IAD21_05822 [Abditibacteriota bacterium]